MTKPYYQTDRCTLYHGDSLAVLPMLGAGSVDAVVTDPPYGLSFMGKHWDYDVPGVGLWAACLEALKPGGHLLAFAGTRTQHRMAVNIEDAGFDIRDMIAWVYGSGFPKSHNLEGEWNGWGTALKPAMEPVTVARKPLDGTVADNVLRHGTGAINVDGCRVAIPDGDGWDVPAPDTKRINPARSSDANGTPSCGRHPSMRHTPSSGRWPANLIHDGSDEVVAGFPQTTSGKMMPTRTTAGVNGRNAYGADKSGGFVTMETYGDSGSAARFFYCPKASKADRDEGCDALDPRSVQEYGSIRTNRGAGYEGASLARNHHPTVKPTDLMRYLCRLVTPPGGVVLDPFCGSGSTGKAAMLEGFRFIGIEREEAYCEIAAKRIQAAERDNAERLVVA